MKLHNESTIQVGHHSINAEMGLPQGSVLSPVLFNVYLEEALKSSAKLEAVRKRGDLLAFADDMLVMTNNQSELTMIIDELEKLQQQWNLRLNKSKSEILTKGGHPRGQWHQVCQDCQVPRVQSNLRPLGVVEGLQRVDRQECKDDEVEDRQGRT